MQRTKQVCALISEHVRNSQVTVHVRTIHTHTYLSVLFLLDLQYMQAVMGTQAPIAVNNSAVKTTMIGMRVLNSSAGGCGGNEPGSVVPTVGDG